MSANATAAPSTLEKLITEIESKVDKLTTLEIRTVVGSFTFTDGKSNGDITTSTPPHVLRTSIDLLQGDITSEIDQWFLAPENKPVLDMHLAREKQGGDVIKANVEALRQIWNLVREMLPGKNAAGGGT